MISDKEQQAIKYTLEWMYPNLTFYINLNDGEVSTWIRQTYVIGGEELVQGREGIEPDKPYKYTDLPNKYFDELNKKVQKIIDNPDKYFYCTNCNQIKPKTELKDNVFSGYYCTDCYEKDVGVRNLVNESHTKGFYD